MTASFAIKDGFRIITSEDVQPKTDLIYHVELFAARRVLVSVPNGETR